MSNIKKANKKNSEEEIVLSYYRPTIFIIIGAVFNIIFASIFSILLVTIILTIPTIVFNALLLVPRVNIKRYWAIWKIVPVVLSFTLAFIIFAGIFFGATFAVEILDNIIDFIDKYILFWHSYWPDFDLATTSGFNAFKIILNWSFIGVAVVGNLLILLGWYKEKELGVLQPLPKEEKKK